MHANPSTAHPCAHTDRDQILSAIESRLADATQDELFKINVLAEAIAYHEIEPLATLIQASTDPKELELLTSVLDRVKAEIARARFQPIFTKEQIKTFGIDVQPRRDINRLLALYVLSFSEKHLAHIAKHDLAIYADYVATVQAAVEDSKAQLEMTESALNRLVLVCLDFAGEVQA